MSIPVSQGNTYAISIAAGQTASISCIGSAVITPSGQTPWTISVSNSTIGPFTVAATVLFTPLVSGSYTLSVPNYLNASTPRTTATVTISIATRAVVTWTTHALVAGSIFVPTTTVALPTGLTAGTAYYVATVIDANNFTLSATPGGAEITTSGTQSGVQTGTASVALTTATAANIAGLYLPAGEWDVQGIVTFATATSTSVTQVIAGISTTSATLGADGSYARMTMSAVVPGAVEWQDQASPVTRVSLTTPTAVYLVGQSTFSVSTQTAGGTIRAQLVK